MSKRNGPKTPETAAAHRQNLVGAWCKIDSWGEAKKAAKKRCHHHRGHYQCEECRDVVPDKVPSVYKGGKKAGQAYKASNFHVDHIEPVVPVTGWVSWDSFEARLFVPAEQRQGLCTTCHKAKTNRETAERVLHRPIKIVRSFPKVRIPRPVKAMDPEEPQDFAIDPADVKLTKFWRKGGDDGVDS